MKNILLLIILSINFNLYSQQYESIVNESKKWNILHDFYDIDASPGNPDVILNTSILKIGTETVINGITYYSMIGAGELSNKRY